MAQTHVCICSYNDSVGFCRELDRLSTDESSAIFTVGVGISEKGLRQTIEDRSVSMLWQIALPKGTHHLP